MCGFHESLKFFVRVVVLAMRLACLLMRGDDKLDMHAGAKNERGMHTDTEETDCEECKCDLYLFAVVSPMRPGRATCPEHAAVLNLPHHQMILLYR